MGRTYLITGEKPAYGKQVNAFIKTLDLGIDGAFVRFLEKGTATLSSDVTDEQLQKLPEAIKSAYEAQGCILLNVVPITITEKMT